MAKQVLVLCTGNSCRSQMAERLFSLLSKNEWIGVSAGSQPAGYVHPKAIEVMKELGVDLSDGVSEHVSVYSDHMFDLVVTVCDKAAASCPSFGGQTRHLHWPFDDPADATGTDEEILKEFRCVREQISDRIKQFLQDESARDVSL